MKIERDAVIYRERLASDRGEDKYNMEEEVTSRERKRRRELDRGRERESWIEEERERERKLKKERGREIGIGERQQRNKAKEGILNKSYSFSPKLFV